MVTKALEWIAEGHGTFEIQMRYQITFRKGSQKIKEKRGKKENANDAL
jgi:hypothetical protein